MYDFGRALSPEEMEAHRRRQTSMRDVNGQLKTELHLKIDAIQRELREQRKMLEQLLEIKAQNQSIKPE